MVLAISGQGWTVHHSYRQTCTLMIMSRRAGDRVIMNEFFYGGDLFTSKKPTFSDGKIGLYRLLDYFLQFQWF